jgi:hypothetical protein
MKTGYIIAITAIMLLVLAGCGEEGECPASCDDGNPCTSDTCSEETGYECRHTPIPGCSLECGTPCTGTAGQYMAMQCDPETKQCASAPKQGLEVSPTQLTKDASTSGNKIRVVLTYNQPFNAKKDTIKVKISAPQIGESASDIKITRIEISGTDENRQSVIIAEKTLNRYIWSISDSVEDELRATFLAGKNDGEFKSLKIVVNYDYVLTIGGTPQPKSTSTSLTFSGSLLKWFNPGITQSCPASCDDGNPGTADTCSAATDYFCEHKPIPGRCGNYVCDPNENKCTCPEDCGPCTGDAGVYLTYLCHDNQCRTRVKPGITPQTIPVTDDRDVGVLAFRNTYTVKNPFNVNTDKVTLDFELYDKNEQVGSVTIAEARLLETNIEIGSAEIGETLESVGSSFTKEIEATAFTGTESEKSLSVKVYVEYQYTTSSGTETRKFEYTKPLGKITLINPTLP